MHVRGLLVGAVLLVLLAGGVWWSQRNEQEQAAKGPTDTPKLSKIQEADVRQVEIRHRQDPPTVLKRDSGGKWELTAPEPLRVDSDAASGLVSAFTNLTWDRLVDEKPSDLSAFGLQSPEVEVVVSGKNNATQRLLIGDATPTGESFYAKLDGDPRVFAVFSSTKTSLDKAAKDLRDKRLLVFDSAKLNRFALNAKGRSLEFEKSGTDWKIVKPQPFRADGGQVEELLRKLKDARMDTSAEFDPKKAETAFASGTPVGEAVLTAESGPQTLQVRKSGADYYARSSAVTGIQKVPADLGETLSKGLDEFRNKHLFDFGFSEPSKIEVRDGAKTYAFTKSGEKWSAGGKQMDAVSVQAFIDKLRDLSAIKFLETGFTTPVIDVIVTSNEGKRVETVNISKTGNQYFAKRAGEPAVYELDSKAVEELQRSASDVKEPPPPSARK